MNEETTAPIYASQKLYVCLEENTLSLHSRTEVDSVIKTAEEDYDGSMPFTVVGNIQVPYKGIPYLFTYKIGPSTIYDVIIAEDEQKAKDKLLSKKRLLGKNVNILATKDLTKLVTDYYE